MNSKQKIDFRVHHRTLIVRRRVGIALGLGILLSGYALLAVDPVTHTHWVLLRVFAGFFCLFVGFCVTAISLFKRANEGNS